MSLFTLDNIKMGCHDEWQTLVDKIKEKATLPNTTIIIFTNVIFHHIHDSMSQLIQETGDNLEDAVKNSSIIVTDINNLEVAILEFQKQKIVQHMSDTRSYLGPNFPPSSSIYKSIYGWEDKAEQIIVELRWDS